MSSTKVQSLKVPGASLHCEVAGSGPALLLVPGAPADAAVFTALRDELADRYTVITYDLRGMSRSTVEDAGEEQTGEIYGSDAHHVLREFTDEPAYVLACSGGALAALDLVARHPEQVRVAVVHEPPLMEMLPNGEQWRDYYQELYDTYRAAGAEAAMGRFFAMTAGFDGPDRDPNATPPSGPPPMPDMSQLPPEMLEMMGRAQGNTDFFFEHMLRPATGYRPDVDALRDSPVPLVVAGGEDSQGQPANRAAATLAAELGTEVVTFPGDHQGFVTHSQGFAAALEKVFHRA